MKHILQEVEAVSKGRVRLLPGTLYTALDRLAAEGLVAHERDERVDGRLRRYYRLTTDGLAALDAQTTRLQHFVTTARARLRSYRPAIS